MFLYADELLLLFVISAVCLFRGIYAPGLNIKALMAPNTRSGTHVGRFLSQHVSLCSLNFRRVASGWLRDRVCVLQNKARPEQTHKHECV